MESAKKGRGMVLTEIELVIPAKGKANLLIKRGAERD
jgi:hypothetical protein